MLQQQRTGQSHTSEHHDGISHTAAVSGPVMEPEPLWREESLDTADEITESKPRQFEPFG